MKKEKKSASYTINADEDDVTLNAINHPTDLNINPVNPVKHKKMLTKPIKNASKLDSTISA